jgi:glycyl-tRNA synthetase
LEDDTVTIRFRDSMEQKRIPVSEIKATVESELDLESILKKI